MSDEFELLEKALRKKYVANFSVFQSVPDSWSIDLLFPVLPIHRLNEYPTETGILVDLTCDSDGQIDHFVDVKDIKEMLELHATDERGPLLRRDLPSRRLPGRDGRLPQPLRNDQRGARGRRRGGPPSHPQDHPWAIRSTRWSGSPGSRRRSCSRSSRRGSRRASGPGSSPRPRRSELAARYRDRARETTYLGAVTRGAESQRLGSWQPGRELSRPGAYRLRSFRKTDLSLRETGAASAGAAPVRFPPVCQDRRPAQIICRSTQAPRSGSCTNGPCGPARAGRASRERARPA